MPVRPIMAASGSQLESHQPRLICLASRRVARCQNAAADESSGSDAGF